MNVNAYPKNQGVEALRYTGRMHKDLEDFFEETDYDWRHFDPPMNRSGQHDVARFEYTRSGLSWSTVFEGEFLVKIKLNSEWFQVRHMSEDEFNEKYEWIEE